MKLTSWQLVIFLFSQSNELPSELPNFKRIQIEMRQSESEM